MEQLKDQTSTQSNNLKLMGLLDDMRAKNDLLSEGILFSIACILPILKLPIPSPLPNNLKLMGLLDANIKILEQWKQPKIPSTQSNNLKLMGLLDDMS